MSNQNHFKLIDNLTNEPTSITLDNLLNTIEKINNDPTLIKTITKYICPNEHLSVSIESIDGKITMQISFEYIPKKNYDKIKKIYDHSNIINLIIDFKHTKYLFSEIKYVRKLLDFDNIPLNLKLLIFILQNNILDNNYGYYNFLFDLKKIPFGLQINILTSGILYLVTFGENVLLLDNPLYDQHKIYFNDNPKSVSFI
jgi:hypothetical protein